MSLAVGACRTCGHAGIDVADAARRPSDFWLFFRGDCTGADGTVTTPCPHNEGCVHCPVTLSLHVRITLLYCAPTLLAPLGATRAAVT